MHLMLRSRDTRCSAPTLPIYVVVMENAFPCRPIRSSAGAMCVLFKLLKSARVFRPKKLPAPSHGGHSVS